MNESYTNHLNQYDKLVSLFPDVDRKGKSMPYTSINGHMFSFLDKEGRLNLRLPNDMINPFIEKHKSSQSIQHGRLMKEYVLVPEGILMDIEALKSYFSSSYDYTKSLKPKPTKK